MSPHLPASRRLETSITRSLINALKTTLSCSLSSTEHTPIQVYDHSTDTRPEYKHISRPRQLKPTPSKISSISKSHFIHRFPVEILSLIFIAGSEEDTSFPITISHVCSSWRQIALRTPELWRRISLGPQESMWRERIRRARTCSLDIELSSSATRLRSLRRIQDLDPYSVYWYMQIALPHIRRWRSLDVDFAHQAPNLWKATLAGLSSPAPLLEELSLRYRNNDDTQEFLLFAGFTPRLRRLTVDGIRLIWTPSLFGNLNFLDYAHHGFTSGHQAVQDIISVLAVTTRITELHVLFPRGRIACLSSRRQMVTQRITLPYLKQLVLKVDGSDIPFEIAHLVTLISSPNLSILRLIDLKRTYHSYQSLKSFFYVYSLPRSLCFIYIGHAWYDPSMVNAMIHSLPHLRKISIRRSRSPGQVSDMDPRTTGIVGLDNDTNRRIFYPARFDDFDIQCFQCSK